MCSFDYKIHTSPLHLVLVYKRLLFSDPNLISSTYEYNVFWLVCVGRVDLWDYAFVHDINVSIYLVMHNIKFVLVVRNKLIFTWIHNLYNLNQ